MRFVKYILFIIACLLILTSCGNGEYILGLKISPLDANASALNTITYSDEQLSSIADFQGSINELELKYPIECIRRRGTSYCAVYTGNQSVAIIHFDNDGNIVFGTKYVKSKFKSDFDALSIGDPLKDVRLIDPNGRYLFLYTGSNNCPRISEHYTYDDYLISIEYNGNNSIKSINMELM